MKILGIAVMLLLLFFECMDTFSKLNASLPAVKVHG